MPNFNQLPRKMGFSNYHPELNMAHPHLIVPSSTSQWFDKNHSTTVVLILNFPSTHILCYTSLFHLAMAYLQNIGTSAVPLSSVTLRTN